MFGRGRIPIPHTYNKGSETPMAHSKGSKGSPQAKEGKGGGGEMAAVKRVAGGRVDRGSSTYHKVPSGKK